MILTVQLKIIAEKEEEFFNALSKITEIIKEYKKSKYELNYHNFMMFFNVQQTTDGFITITVNDEPFIQFIGDSSTINDDKKIAEYICDLLNEKHDTICPNLKFSLNPSVKDK